MGRRRPAAAARLAGILVALRPGIPRGMPPQGLGCGAGPTRWRRRRDRREAGVRDRLHRALRDRLGGADHIDWSQASLDRAGIPGRGGEVIGPSPANHGKPGTERHLVVDRAGLPLAALADQADNIPRCRRAPRRRHSRVPIARTGVDAHARLGRHRWVVEPTLA